MGHTIYQPRLQHLNHRGHGPITMTPTQRVQALRQRRKALGLARVEFYLTQEHAIKVRAYVSKLTKEKSNEAN